MHFNLYTFVQNVRGRGIRRTVSKEFTYVNDLIAVQE